MAANFAKKIFLHSVGYTYSNLSRLFLRLFTGVMFLVLCVRQALHFEELAPSVSGLFGLSHEGTMAVVLALELLCATFIILGLLTRFAVLPPLVMMFMAESSILNAPAAVGEQLYNFQPGYPIMFIGIFIYFLLAGPGKISLDYIISVHLVDSNEENDVVENA